MIRTKFLASAALLAAVALTQTASAQCVGGGAAGNIPATGTGVVSPPDSAAVDVVSPSLGVAVTVSTGGGCPGVEVVNILAGTGVTWCYTVTNTGDTALEGVRATDLAAGLVPGTPVSLAAGQSFTFSRSQPIAVDTTVTGDVLTSGGASTAVSAIDSALDAITTSRATYGAAMSRFQFAISNLQITGENQSAARGRIMDADFAAETANLSRAQILQQAGTAMVAQANQLPQQVLQLLKG